MTLITFILIVAILSAMLGMMIGFSIGIHVNKPKRKRKRPLEDWEYEVLIYKRELAAWQANKVLMKPMPLDTSWGNMSAEKLERLEYIRKYFQSGWERRKNLDYVETENYIATWGDDNKSVEIKPKLTAQEYIK